MTQITTLLSLFIIIAAGALTAKLNFTSEHFSKDINKFVFYIAFPAIIIVSLASTNRSELDLYPKFLLVNGLIILVLRIALVAVLKVLPWAGSDKGLLSYTSLGGNTGFFGFPIILALFEPTHFNLTVIYVTVLTTIDDALALLIIGLFKKDSNEPSQLQNALTDFLKNPIVIASVLGFLLLILELDLPEIIGLPLELLGGTTSAMALFSLGIFTYENLSLPDPQLLFKIGFSTIIKLLIFPAVVYLALTYIFTLNEAATQTSVILAAMPSAVFSIILADIFDLDRKLATQVVIVSSVLFLGTSVIWLGFIT